MLFSSLFGLKLHWLAVVVVALILNGANLFGYVRCKFSSRKQLGSLATQYLGRQLFKAATETTDDEKRTPLSAETF